MGLRWRSIWALAILAVGLGLFLRWNLFYLNFGSAFVPYPDSLEYVAGGQAIAQHGRFFLQVGPYEVRSRYPPGLSMALAVPLKAGVRGEDVWRCKSALGTLNAFLLGLLVAAFLRRSGCGEAGAVAVGALASVHWLLLPLNLAQANMVMSDEPTLLGSLLVVLLLATTWDDPAGARPGRLIVAGLLVGAVAITRTPGALLLLPPLLPYFRRVVRERGWPDLLQRGGWVLLGVLPPVLAAIALLVRSGFPALSLSAYQFWVPEHFDEFGKIFSARWALHGNPVGPLPGGMIDGHLEVGAKIMLGWAGPLAWEAYGLYWPLLGWGAGLVLAFFAWRRGTAEARRLALGVLLLALSTYLFYGLYAFPGGRFYLPAMAACVVVFWYAIGRLLRRDLAARALALGMVAVAAYGTWTPIAANRNTYKDRTDTTRVTRTMIAGWLAMGDEARASRRIPADPVVAQAIGLLGPDVIAPIHEWGQIPETKHVHHLIRFGHLTPGGEIGPDADRRYLHRSPVAGTAPPIEPVVKVVPKRRALFEDDFEEGDLRYWSAWADAEHRPAW